MAVIFSVVYSSGLGWFLEPVDLYPSREASVSPLTELDMTNTSTSVAFSVTGIVGYVITGGVMYASRPL